MGEPRLDMDNIRHAAISLPSPQKGELRSIRRARRVATVISVLAIASIVASVWLWQWSGGPPAKAETTTLEAEQYLTIQRQPIFTNLNMVGSIGPARSVAMVAPFDGVISERRKQLGDTVQVGDILLALDAGDVTSQYRTAQSAFLKAQMAVAAMQEWETSADVLRAKRTLAASETSLGALNRQIQDVKGLFDQGIVSRNEYEGLVQQSEVLQSQVESNRQDLKATLQRGSQDNRQLLELDLQNAAAKLNELKQQLSGAKVAAAVPGILTSPPVEKGSEKAQIEPGARVVRGTPLFGIADTTSFVATGAVDEVDVSRIQVGQSASIAMDAIPGQTIPGKIISVSAEAAQQHGSGQPPLFQVRASFMPSSVDQRQAIRFGMSAQISIETYSNPGAIVVSPSVIVDTGGGPHVYLRRSGQDIMTPVLLGATFPQGVEVVSGLEVGDQVRIRK